MRDIIEPLNVQVDGSIFSRFADLTRDNNPIHRDRFAANTLGFRDTPAQGVYVMSGFERLARANGFSFNNYSVKFKSPAFPKDNLTFSGNILGGEVSFEAKNQDSNLVATCKLDLSGLRSYSPKGEVVGSFDYSLREGDTGGFHSLLRSGNVWFPSTLVASLIPASLLEFATDDSGKPIGIYRGIDVSSFGKTGTGNYKTNIFRVSEPRQLGDGFIYSLRGVCSKDGSPILSGDIKVISPKRLNF